MRTSDFLSVIFLITMLFLHGCSTKVSQSDRDYPITPVDFTQVKLQEGFWKNWVSLTVQQTIPFCFEKCEETGRIANFIHAAGIREGKFQGRYGFNDSDLYKIMEGAAYSLMLEENHSLAAYLDSLVYYVSEAQEDDGYLYTAWSLQANDYIDFACCTYHADGQWIGTSGASHELYNVGHMYEAAVAHYLATGERTFLDVAIRNADLVYDVCMVQGMRIVPGHQEIEIGLAKLYRVTGDERYMQLAKHLLDIRSEVIDHEYSQAHLPVIEQREAVGHAVRANYMYAAMADVAALSGDSAYLDAIGKIWENVVEKKLSITGGVGASHRGEAYGPDYDLPNHPYNETCAAIANVYWNHRLFLLHGESKYIDVLERALYNGVISGLSLDGTLFFYPNTLQHDGEKTFNQGVNGRSPWFNCSCCPSNLSRFIPSVAGYAYATRGEKIYVNLFMNSEVSFEMGNTQLTLQQQSSYPWNGRIRIEILNTKPASANILIRIPGWARNRPVPSDLFSFSDGKELAYSISVNGKTEDALVEKGYVSLEGKWTEGDRIEIIFPMESRIIKAHKNVEEKTGLKAVQFGPVVYCAEETDNYVDILSVLLDESSDFNGRYEPGLLGGVNTLEGDRLILIPYYAWANRNVGKMNVWFK